MKIWKKRIREKLLARDYEGHSVMKSRGGFVSGGRAEVAVGQQHWKPGIKGPCEAGKSEDKLGPMKTWKRPSVSQGFQP